MLSFLSKNDKKIFPAWTVVLKKADQSDGKPTYFYIWPHSSYMYGTGHVKSSLNQKFTLHNNRFTMPLFIKN